MEFRQNPRVFRAWRVERYKARRLDKLESPARTSRGKREQRDFNRKGRSY